MRAILPCQHGAGGTARDEMELVSYSALMGEQSAFLTLKIDTEQPVELRDFVGAFTSLGNEFERYVRDAYPGTAADPKMFVREVRYGCIEADMITGIAVAALNHMEQILILEDFVRRWGERFGLLRAGHVPPDQLNTSAELKDWADAAKSIASDPVASHRITAMTFKDGQRKITASFEFKTPEARAALQHIEERRLLLEKPKTEPRSRVLMRFTRTDVHDAAVGKRSGERVVITELDGRDKPVMFASEMVEHEIRSYIREDDDNVYKRGFVVDVAAQMSGDRIIAYSVLALHSVLDDVSEG